MVWGSLMAAKTITRADGIKHTSVMETAWRYATGVYQLPFIAVNIENTVFALFLIATR